MKVWLINENSQLLDILILVFLYFIASMSENKWWTTAFDSKNWFDTLKFRENFIKNEPIKKTKVNTVSFAMNYFLLFGFFERTINELFELITMTYNKERQKDRFWNKLFYSLNLWQKVDFLFAQAKFKHKNDKFVKITKKVRAIQAKRNKLFHFWDIYRFNDQDWNPTETNSNWSSMMSKKEFEKTKKDVIKSIENINKEMHKIYGEWLRKTQPVITSHYFS